VRAGGLDGGFGAFDAFLDGSSQEIRFDPSRVAAQIVTGIGFLGAGAIIRYGMTVRGLTTAASLWVVAAIGFLVCFGLYGGTVFGQTLDWAIRAGAGESATQAMAIAVDGIGDSYVAGMFFATATFGPGETGEVTLTSFGNRDLFVARYADNGQLAWVVQAGESRARTNKRAALSNRVAGPPAHPAAQPPSAPLCTPLRILTVGQSEILARCSKEDIPVQVTPARSSETPAGRRRLGSGPCTTSGHRSRRGSAARCDIGSAPRSTGRASPSR
jgi:hypothetical protein